MAPRPPHPAMAPCCHVQSAKVVRRPPPLLEVRTPIIIAIWGKSNLLVYTECYDGKKSGIQLSGLKSKKMLPFKMRCSSLLMTCGMLGIHNDVFFDFWFSQKTESEIWNHNKMNCPQFKHKVRGGVKHETKMNESQVILKDSTHEELQETV